MRILPRLAGKSRVDNSTVMSQAGQPHEHKRTGLVVLKRSIGPLACVSDDLSRETHGRDRPTRVVTKSENGTYWPADLGAPTGGGRGKADIAEGLALSLELLRRLVRALCVRL